MNTKHTLLHRIFAEWLTETYSDTKDVTSTANLHQQEQCDQMLEYKVAQCIQKLPKM